MAVIKVVPMPGVAVEGPQGPTGPQGEPGSSANTGDFTFDENTASTLGGMTLHSNGEGNIILMTDIGDVYVNGDDPEYRVATVADLPNIGDFTFDGSSITTSGEDLHIGNIGVPGTMSLSAYSGVEVNTAEGFGLYVNGTDPGNKVVTFDDLPGGTGLGYYGSFFSSQTQTGTENSAQAMTLNTTDFADGVSIVNNSRITLANAGKYNILFSAQLYNTSGPTSTVNIWLSKNGTAVELTNTRLSVTSNNPYLVAAWNFFVDAAAGDYFELIWSASNVDTEIAYVGAQTVNSIYHPAIPSVILTVNQVGL